MKHISLYMLVAAGCGSVADEPKPDAAAVLDASVDAPPAEQCNGEDDDTDGTIDEGCPSEGALAFAPGESGPVIGSETTFGQAGTKLELRCPVGSIVTGLFGRAYESIDAIGALCGVPAVKRSAATPYDYSIEIADGATLPPVGGPGGSAFEAKCPAHTAVVGATFETATNANGTTIYGVTLECSAFAIGGGNKALARSGEPVVLKRIATGNASVPTMPTAYGCPSNQVLGSVTGAYGPWPLYSAYTMVNALQLHCVTPSVQVIDG